MDREMGINFWRAARRNSYLKVRLCVVVRQHSRLLKDAADEVHEKNVYTDLAGKVKQQGLKA